jgi:hypothetical protein
VQQLAALGSQPVAFGLELLHALPQVVALGLNLLDELGQLGQGNQVSAQQFPPGGQFG